VCEGVWESKCAFVAVCVCVRVCTDECSCVCICVREFERSCVCVCVFACMHDKRERARVREKLRDRKKGEECG